MYSFFYGTFMHTSMNTNATDSIIVHLPKKKRKQIKEKVGMVERSQTELQKKEEVRLEVRIITRQAIILIFSSPLTYSMLCIS